MSGFAIISEIKINEIITYAPDKSLTRDLPFMCFSQSYVPTF